MHALKIKPVNSLNILIIDDSASERVRLKYILTKLGHQVIEASSGREALSYFIFSAQHIDFVLVDVRMPTMDGYETTRRIRAFEKDNAKEWHPIIFLSGRTAPADIAKGIEAGGDDYLAKPVDSVVLTAKISAMQRIADMRQRLLEATQQLEVLANTDELTHLPNRRHFLSMLDAEISRSKRHNLPLAVAYFDLDHFKQINDNYGHEIGDYVLREIANTLAENLRTEDSIGRLGGEEFCLCLPGAAAETVMNPCERYRALIEKLDIHYNDSIKLQVTASFGITNLTPRDNSIKDVLERADKALYEAKRKGRNRVEIL